MKNLLLFMTMAIVLGCGKKSQPETSDPFFSDKEISTVSQMVGTHVFISDGENDSILIQIEDISVYTDTAGEVVIGKLLGGVVSGSATVKGIRIDKSREAETYGWKKVTELNDLLLHRINDSVQFQFETLRFRTAQINGYKTLVTSKIEGLNVINNKRMSFNLAINNPICLGVPTFTCANLYCNGSCRVIKGEWIDDCDCAATGACYWRFSGTNCVIKDCTVACTKLVPWAWDCLC